jgi:YcaO-like protein with predicted kinase domain
VPVLVPANLVFLPYITTDDDKYFVFESSNGLASGNNIEEAILHGLIELIGRDQVLISEYNRLPFKRITQESLPDACSPILELLANMGFQVYILSGTSDIPVPFIAAFIQNRKTLLYVLSHLAVIPIQLLLLNVL